jgi:2-polyprenyl-3-methyl-5-hydroxy-6-metoxy-1,4-benzoquinol methylase
MDATAYNRETYNRIWEQMSDYIRYNPGARHRRRHVFKLLDKQNFTSLLDVGCGNGELLRMIDAHYPGKQLTGLDLSEAVVKQNQTHLPAMAFGVGNVETDVINLKKLKQKDGFDVVVCTEVLEHLTDPATALKHLADACKKGGVVIVTCPTGHMFPTERFFGHVKHPKPHDIRGWAADAGLDVEQLWQWGFPWYALTKVATNINADAALKRFAGDKPYGFIEKAISTTLYAANFANLTSSRGGVQLFVRMKKR